MPAETIAAAGVGFSTSSLVAPSISSAVAPCIGSLTLPISSVASKVLPTAPSVVAASATLLTPAQTIVSTNGAVASHIEPAPVTSPVICATGRKPLLEAGAIVNIQGNNYHVSEPLGMGSFGAVWAAERRDGVKGADRKSVV